LPRSIEKRKKGEVSEMGTQLFFIYSEAKKQVTDLQLAVKRAGPCRVF
jgi:hypothetical protein